ncbi:MFS transporter [Cadophora sp. MPI-SDFR-AT-0126]|nr:MFS transporter [Leotiomycetes sp. MPI-SDFR-AT-0126]
MASAQSWNTCTAGDPKFWPSSIRYIILANICIYVFLGTMFTAGLATGFESLAGDFHVPFSQLTDTVSYPVLALGVASILWMPTAICLGKRPVLLVSCAIFLVCNIWCIEATSLNGLIAARVIAAFGAGSIEAVGPAIIADLFMEQYFASAMAIFSLSLSGGSQIGPMIAGYLVSSRGWRWFFILIAILLAINLVLMIFFLPETNFRRILFNAETAAEADKVAVEMVESNADNNRQKLSTVQGEVQPDQALYAGSYWKDLVQFKNRGVENTGIMAWLRQFSLPFRFILVPHAFFAAVSYGVFLGGIVVISTLNPSFFAPQPYLFTSAGLGLFSCATFLGIVIAYPVAGPLTDLLSRMFMKRNDYVHLPEHRMPALVVPFLICPPGLLLYAYMIDQQGSYYAAAVGASMQLAAMVLVPSVVLSVVVDAYPRSGSEALVLINAGKNLVAFGMSVKSNSWLASEGVVKMFWEVVALQWAVLTFGLPLYFAGPWLRKITLFLV